MSTWVFDHIKVFVASTVVLAVAFALSLLATRYVATDAFEEILRGALVFSVFTAADWAYSIGRKSATRPNENSG